MNEILTGKVCPYCGKAAEYVDSSIIYGRSYGTAATVHGAGPIPVAAT